MTIEELKAKANEIKIAKKKLEAKEEMMNVIISSIATDGRFEATSKNIIALNDSLLAIKNSIDDKEDDSVVVAISEQTKALKDENSIKIVERIETLIKEINSLDKNKLTKELFKKEINSSVDKVVNTIINQNEIPNETIYTRNSKNKIASVLEIYEDFTIKSVWRYDSKGHLINVKTTKNATQ